MECNSLSNLLVLDTQVGTSTVELQRVSRDEWVYHKVLWRGVLPQHEHFHVSRIEVVFTEVPVFVAGTVTVSVVPVLLMAALQSKRGRRGRLMVALWMSS